MRRKYKPYSIASLKAMQEYFQAVLELTIRFRPENLENVDWSGQEEQDFLALKAREAARLKTELNAIFKELVFRKLTSGK